MSMRKRPAISVSTVDPPTTATGALQERALVEPAVGGNGFPNPSPLEDDAAWMVAIEADDKRPNR